MPNTTTAAEVMTKRLITFRADDTISHAISVLVKHRISGAPVINNVGRLIGMLSEKDCMRVLVHEYYAEQGAAVDKRVRELMTTKVHTIPSDMVLSRIAEQFTQHPFRRLPVVDNDELVGQVSRRDVLVAIHRLTSQVEKRSARPRQGEGDNLLADASHLGSVMGPALNQMFGLKMHI